MKKIIFLISLFSLASVLLLPVLVSASEPAPIFNEAAKRIETTSNKAQLGNPNQRPSEIVSEIVSVVIGILGVVSVVLILYSGGLWLTAAGSEEKVTKAKKIMKSTVVGIVIVGLAYAITNFILDVILG